MLTHGFESRDSQAGAEQRMRLLRTGGCEYCEIGSVNWKAGARGSSATAESGSRIFVFSGGKSAVASVRYRGTSVYETDLEDKGFGSASCDFFFIFGYLRVQR